MSQQPIKPPSSPSATRSDGARTLQKDLCIRCHNEHRSLPWGKQPAKNRDWDERGRVACVALLGRLGGFYHPVTNPPPPDCHYYLEQLLHGQWEGGPVEERIEHDYPDLFTEAPTVEEKGL